MATSSPGKLIVFEGIDGSGKTLHQLRCVKWLQERNYQPLALCEPTYGPKGSILRESAKNGRLTPEEELNHFIEDRRWNVQNNIQPGIDQGKIVLLDRYYFSSMAYQGARGIDPTEIRRKCETFAPQPDLLLLFDLAPETALERIQNKRGESPNLFEKIDYLRKVRDIFLSLDYPYLLRIDASADVETVWSEVAQALEKLFKN